MLDSYFNQLKTREIADEHMFEDSIEMLHSAVSGEDYRFRTILNEEGSCGDVANIILRYYGMPEVELPGNVKTVEEQLQYALRPYGFSWREVELSGNWRMDGAGIMLGKKRDGSPVVLLPRKGFGYDMCNPVDLSTQRVKKSDLAQLDATAICFYQPFKGGKLSIKDLLKYMWSCITTADLVLILGVNIVATLVALIPTWGNDIIFNQIVGFEKTALPAVVGLLLGATLSISLFQIMKTLVTSRITIKVESMTEAAFISRMLEMPLSFFNKYSAGEMATRVDSLKNFCEQVMEIVFNLALSVLLSLLYVIQIAIITPSLALPCFIVVVLTAGVNILVSYWKISQQRKITHAQAEVSGIQFSLIQGVQKLRLSHSEKRAFSKWAEKYADEAAAACSPPKRALMGSAANAFVNMGGLIFLYWTAARTGLSGGDYMAFSVAYGGITASFSMLSQAIPFISGIFAYADMIKPLLAEEPENNRSLEYVHKLSGGIQLDNVCFRYEEESPNIIDNLSLKIRQGQYVAIVGPSGCGKSTLMKVMLGFLKPQLGSVYFGGKDISTLDPVSFRRHIGVVEQDGQLFKGNVFKNIAITNPKLSLDEAWEIAEIAGIADDIRRMPMQMHTYISDGEGGLSGGQRQRLLIARAIASNPKILMMDEATSALDNVTQKKVSDALAKIHCTRIVIAHRLSTIRECDRIIVLDKGHIVEEGNFDQLVEKHGVFYELVKRQRVNDSE